MRKLTSNDLNLVNGGTRMSDTATGGLLGAGLGAGAIISFASMDNYVAPWSLILLGPAVAIGGMIGAMVGFIKSSDHKLMNNHY